jgi:hypothetical protein
MATRWELVVALAREVDEDCAAGRKLDLTRVARLARAVLDFQQGLVGGPEAPRVAPGSVPPPPAAPAGPPQPPTPPSVPPPPSQQDPSVPPQG